MQQQAPGPAQPPAAPVFIDALLCEADLEVLMMTPRQRADRESHTSCDWLCRPKDILRPWSHAADNSSAAGEHAAASPLGLHSLLQLRHAIIDALQRLLVS